MTDVIEISKSDLDRMEAHFQQGLQICYRLKKQLGSTAMGPSSRKGLDENQKAQLTGNRKKNLLKRAS